jgi:LPXTG-motif cell wall-anchored protein
MDAIRERVDQPAIREVAPMAGVAAVLLVAALVAGAGFVIYRRRRRRSLADRIQNMLPDVDELRASVRKPLERVVKAL